MLADDLQLRTFSGLELSSTSTCTTRVVIVSRHAHHTHGRNRKNAIALPLQKRHLAFSLLAPRFSAILSNAISRNHDTTLCCAILSFAALYKTLTSRMTINVQCCARYQPLLCPPSQVVRPSASYFANSSPRRLLPTPDLIATIVHRSVQSVSSQYACVLYINPGGAYRHKHCTTLFSLSKADMTRFQK